MKNTDEYLRIATDVMRGVTTRLRVTGFRGNPTRLVLNNGTEILSQDKLAKNLAEFVQAPTVPQGKKSLFDDLPGGKDNPHYKAELAELEAEIAAVPQVGVAVVASKTASEMYNQPLTERNGAVECAQSVVAYWEGPGNTHMTHVVALIQQAIDAAVAQRDSWWGKRLEEDDKLHHRLINIASAAGLFERGQTINANNATDRIEVALTAVAEKCEPLVAALGRIEQWGQAYPLTVFPEPDFKKARALLEAGGMTLDAISASNMRHVVEGVQQIAVDALNFYRSGKI